MSLFTGRTVGFFNCKGGGVFNGVRHGILSGKGLSSGSGVPPTYNEAMEDNSGNILMEDGSGGIRMEQP